MQSIKNYLLAISSLSIFASCTTNEKTESPKFPTAIEHVIVIGIDGMCSQGLEVASTPNMDKLINEGAYCDRVRNVHPISSAPNWSALLTAVPTEVNSVISNSWRKDSVEYQPVCVNEQGLFPTVFSVIRAQKPQAEIGMIYDWGGMSHLFERELVNYDKQISPERATAASMAEYIKEKKPLFLFSQLDGVDAGGHKHGFMSEGYFESITAVDSLVGVIVKGVEDAGIEESSMIMVVADHGGFGHSHGSYERHEINVPIILYGAGVKKGYKVVSDVYTMDCSPTITFALGLENFAGWRGKAISEAFIGFETPKDIVKVKHISKD